jgi:hypothetical protein
MTLIRHSDLYHTGIVVDDIQKAKEEWRALAGIEWGPQGSAVVPCLVPGGPTTVTFEYAFSSEGPHYLELLQSVPGTLWATPAVGHAHHLGYWCDDVSGTATSMAGLGLQEVARVGTSSDAEPPHIVWLRPEQGPYIELVSRSVREVLFGME